MAENSTLDLSNMDFIQLKNTALQNVKDKKYSEALDIWAEVRRRWPDKAQGYFMAANICSKLRYFKKADVICKEGIEKCTSPNFDLLVSFAEIKSKQLKHKEAIARWDEVRKLFPDIEVGYRRSAMSCREIGQNELAERICLEGIEKCSDRLRLYQLYASLSLEGNKPYHEKLKNLLRRRQILCRQFDSILELAKMAYACDELSKYEPSYYFYYNDIVANILRKYNGETDPVLADKKPKKMCCFCTALGGYVYIKPIIRYINPSFIDIVVGRKTNADSELIKSFGLESYNILYGLEEAKNYEYVLIQDMHLYPDYIGDLKAKFIVVHHNIEHDIGEYYLKNSLLVINELAHEKYLQYVLKPESFDSSNIKIYNQIDKTARCEITHTGMYHIDKYISDPEERYLYRKKIMDKIDGELDENKPVVLFMENGTSNLGQIIYCLNRICDVANVILKLWRGDSKSYIMSKLDPRVILYNNLNWCQNDLRYCADFILAGYRSGTLISSLMLGLNVIPYYSRIEYFLNSRRTGWLIDCFRFINNNDPNWELHKRLCNYLKLFDLLKPDEIRKAITGNEYTNWYHKMLPVLHREVFGDHAKAMGGGAARLAAEYIMRFVRNGTLGKDCKAVYLKEQYFNKPEL